MMIYVHSQTSRRWATLSISRITTSLTVHGTQATQVYFRFNDPSPEGNGNKKLDPKYTLVKYTLFVPRVVEIMAVNIHRGQNEKPTFW